VTAYLDTSSLVKLYTDEAGSDQVRMLLSSVAAVATSVVAYPEARAAFARGRREGWLTSKSFSEIKRSFEHDWQAIGVRQIDGDLAREAGELAERYALRGFDGVHLASFLDLRRRNPDILFSSFDARLNRAARSAVRRGV
jgi:predicted nucleic acid-binding protein